MSWGENTNITSMKTVLSGVLTWTYKYNLSANQQMIMLKTLSESLILDNC